MSPIPLLTVSGLNFGYSPDHPVLRDVALNLAPGEVVALLGPNGSGKTTLIRTLLGHLHAQGSIDWDGRPLSQWSRRDLARRVAYLPQTPTFDPGQTVGDILRLGRAPYWRTFGIESTHDIEVVQQIASLLDLTALLPRPMDSISGGQRQRVFLGRCLTQEPAAMLLDEPNTFLDLKHQIELGKLLRSLAKEKSIAVLMASHDINLAATFADRLVLLSEGTIAANGSPSEVLTPEILTKVYGVAMDRTEVGDPPRPLVYPEAG
jgi:iron complex transport system ATP-binding protein